MGTGRVPVYGLHSNFGKNSGGPSVCAHFTVVDQGILLLYCPMRCTLS